ncbi:hypothetical protein L9F63_001092, partial [Diploptera punctata]
QVMARIKNAHHNSFSGYKVRSSLASVLATPPPHSLSKHPHHLLTNERRREEARHARINKLA